MPAKPPEHTKWKPGQSGNPSGRPKGIARQARELVGDDPHRLLQVLLAVAEDEGAKDSDRIAASREYLDRAWGKSLAFDPVSHDGDPLEMGETDQRINQIMDELAARREAQAASAAANGALAANGKSGATPA